MQQGHEVRGNLPAENPQRERPGRKREDHGLERDFGVANRDDRGEHQKNRRPRRIPPSTEIKQLPQRPVVEQRGDRDRDGDKAEGHEKSIPQLSRRCVHCVSPEAEATPDDRVMG